ncbi:purine-cytosine permease FCY22 [Metarhizium acridum CQMa 102]|uniref:Purine-cytosine permease FCY22 n=1 Tax=Metarhizium acridum (strain CQMa 102) TaxID=655827 RepID=E9ECW3_METAQ|nr:purine-cytosine permease FCY22 [Metarhizium acridum CQMa 102]EFY86257.1 purine-cytosine permease FCY22 [Metarhizium acridum CQMa 102]
MAEQYFTDEKSPSSTAMGTCNHCQRPPCRHSPTSSSEIDGEEHRAGCVSTCDFGKCSQSAPSERIPSVARKLLRAGRVEENGIRPLAAEERKQKRFCNIFTVWFSINSNILGITFGMLGPLVYNLSLRDSILVIVFFNLLAAIAAGILATFGPKTGMRQMIHARYSFGRYLVSIPVLLNLATLTGFTAIICVVGGECLSAISSGTITPNVGIVVISILSLIVSFAGFKVLHIFETFSFIPALISIIIAAGVGGSGLKQQKEPAAPVTAADILTFGMIIAAYQIPWAAIASDLTTYFDPKVPSWRVFHYTYWGLVIPTVLLMSLGAAIAGALPNNPIWEEGHDAYGVGGVLAAMLSSAGGFGKFVVVLQTLSLLGNTCGSFYAITLNFQALAPILFKVPRYVFAVVVTAIIIPVAIYAYRDFYAGLNNFMSLISYWSAAFVGIVMTDHVVIRRCRFDSYDQTLWDKGSKLPLGVAAISSGVVAFGLVVPCMKEEWYVGPIAEKAGDIGFEVAFALSALAYVPLRILEERFTGR